MTPSFYYIRHGITEANIRGEFCGCGWDIDLSDLGKQQAEAAAEILRGLKHDIRTVCYSPLLRTRQTKDILATALPQASFVEAPDMREWDVGTWDHQKINGILKPSDDFLSLDPPNGETHTAFRYRIDRGLDFCLQHPSSVLIVAHGAVGGMLLKKFGIADERIDNATLYRFDLESLPRLIKFQSAPMPH